LRRGGGQVKSAARGGTGRFFALSQKYRARLLIRAAGVTARLPAGGLDLYNTRCYTCIQGCRWGHVRIFKNKSFARFARKARIADAALCEAIGNAERGLIDADLGGGVIKQRIARPGRGKSGGFRTIILFRAGARAFFVHGFAKNEQDNIRDDELAAFKMLTAELLAYDDAALAKAIDAGVFMEVMRDDKAIS
jgi:hypothetical protein